VKKVLKIVASFIGHTLYLTGSVLFTILFLPVVILCKYAGNYKIPSLLLYFSLSFFVRKVLAGLCVIEMKDVKGLDKISSLGPAVYVCNHRGKLDGPLILSFVKNLKPTMKSKYAKRPVFRIFVKWFDFCEIDLRSNQKLIETSRKCSRILEKQSLLFFPEGTRKTSDKLSDFRKMAFKTSADNNVPVVPVLLYNNTPFMTKKLSSFFPLDRVQYKIHFLEPVYPSGKSVSDLTNTVYDLMNAEMLEMSIEKT